MKLLKSEAVGKEMSGKGSVIRFGFCHFFSAYVSKQVHFFLLARPHRFPTSHFVLESPILSDQPLFIYREFIHKIQMKNK